MEEQKLKMTRNTTPPVRPTVVGAAVPAQGAGLPLQMTSDEMVTILNEALDAPDDAIALTRDKVSPKVEEVVINDLESAERKPAPELKAPKFVPQDEVLDDVKQRLKAPAGYIPVKLSSCGKLGIPEILHVRDYIGSDALKMAQMNDDNQLEIMCGVLQGMLYEKIDVLDLHEEDMKEILLSVHATFWGDEIKGYFYPMNEEEFALLPEEKRKRIEQGKEFPTVDLPIRNIITTPIFEEVGEPINITLPDKSGGSTSVSFILPRVGHEVYAQRYVSKKYAYQEEKFGKVAAQIKQAERESLFGMEEITKTQIDPEQREAYQKYLIERQSLMVAIKQAQQIVAFNGKECRTIEEKLKAYEQISVQFWAQLRHICATKFQFGVMDLVKMTSPFTEEEVLRNARFQYMDFVPSDRLDGSNEFIVTFGKL